MKPNFALDLSHEGIGLFHRSKGGWTLVGDVALDDPDLADKIEMLRKTAADLSPGGFTTKLVIPDSQILFTTLTAPGPDDIAREVQIRAGLDGLTPYEVGELVFDWQADGDDAHVAVLARETLAEAEAFAADHRLNPVSFVARGKSGAFAGEPFFGRTGAASTLLGPGQMVERDTKPLPPILSSEDASDEPATAAPEPVDAPDATVEAEMPGAETDPQADPTPDAEEGTAPDVSMPTDALPQATLAPEDRVDAPPADEALQAEGDMPADEALSADLPPALDPFPPTAEEQAEAKSDTDAETETDDKAKSEAESDDWHKELAERLAEVPDPMDSPSALEPAKSAGKDAASDREAKSAPDSLATPPPAADDGLLDPFPLLADEVDEAAAVPPPAKPAPGGKQTSAAKPAKPPSKPKRKTKTPKAAKMPKGQDRKASGPDLDTGADDKAENKTKVPDSRPAAQESTAKVEDRQEATGTSAPEKDTRADTLAPGWSGPDKRAQDAAAARSESGGVGMASAKPSEKPSVKGSEKPAEQPSETSEPAKPTAAPAGQPASWPVRFSSGGDSPSFASSRVIPPAPDNKPPLGGVARGADSAPASNASAPAPSGGTPAFKLTGISAGKLADRPGAKPIGKAPAKPAPTPIAVTAPKLPDAPENAAAPSPAEKLGKGLKSAARFGVSGAAGVAGQVGRVGQSMAKARAARKAEAADQAKIAATGKGGGKGQTATPPAKGKAKEVPAFGARKTHEIGGKPRYMGLVLILLLLLAMAVAAVWSMVAFTDRPEARFDTPGSGVATDVDQGGTTASVAPDGAGGAVVPPAQQPAATGMGGTDEARSVTPATPGLPPIFTPPVSQPPVVLPPVSGPPIPTTPEVLGREAADVRYAATGIWERAPDAPQAPQGDRVSDIYIASIDPELRDRDPVALPRLGEEQRDGRNAIPAPPAPPGTRFDFDERGFVRATQEGALTPEGIVVYSGQPTVVPGRRPAGLVPAADAAPDASDTAPEIPRIRPTRRPEGLIEDNERASLGGLSRRELAAIRPARRPADLVPDAAATRPDAAALEAAVGAAVAENGLSDATLAAATASAVVRSPLPGKRPANFDRIVARAVDNSDGSVAVAAAAVTTPSIPTRASVAEQATIDNALNLRRVNLIGVYGAQNARRALVRLPSGRFVKVRVGDRLDGGKVTSISSSKLIYQKGGRSHTLKVPPLG